MTTSRRRFLKTLGIAAAVPGILTAQTPRVRRSRWDLLFSGGDPIPASMKPTPSAWRNDTITAAWIGHSTVLINFFGTTIITDPVLSERIGVNLAGLATVGPKRLVLPAMTVEELPKIDLILLSHAHMDHLDLATLAKLDRGIPVVMAKNTSDVIDGLAMHTVTELDWGETTYAAGVVIEALRVRHFGWRMPWETDRSRGNWNGRSFNAYVLSKNGRKIFFGGDTAMQEFTAEAGAKGLKVDLAIMPIGAYDPWIHNHCTPEQAIAMADTIGSPTIMPIHWGTFIQSDEPTAEPIERFRAALVHQPGRIALDTHGQTWTLPAQA